MAAPARPVHLVRLRDGADGLSLLCAPESPLVPTRHAWTRRITSATCERCRQEVERQQRRGRDA